MRELESVSGRIATGFTRFGVVLNGFLRVFADF